MTKTNKLKQAYYTAWSYTKSHLPTDLTNSTQPKQKALLKFIDNWTNDEFKKFVDECKEVFDGLEIEPGTEIGNRCEDVSLIFVLFLSKDLEGVGRGWDVVVLI